MDTKMITHEIYTCTAMTTAKKNKIVIDFLVWTLKSCQKKAFQMNQYHTIPSKTSHQYAASIQCLPKPIWNLQNSILPVTASTPSHEMRIHSGAQSWPWPARMHKTHIPDEQCSRTHNRTQTNGQTQKQCSKTDTNQLKMPCTKTVPLMVKRAVQ